MDEIELRGKISVFSEILAVFLNKTIKTYKTLFWMWRGNRLATGKEPVGDFPSNNGFVGFVMKLISVF